MYRSIEESFWTAPDVKSLPPTTKLLFLYLITNPHSHISGLYYLPLQYVVHDTGLPMEEVRRGIDTLSMGYQASYDPSTEMVFVTNMLEYQGRGEKIAACVQKHVRSLHKSFLIKQLFERYPHVAFDLGYPIDTPSMPHRDQEQYQEQLQERSKPAPAPKPRGGLTPTLLTMPRKLPRGCTCDKHPGFEGECRFTAFQRWAWEERRSLGETAAWTAPDMVCMQRAYHAFDSDEGARRSWLGFLADMSDYVSGHYPKKWSTEPARWPLPARTPMNPRPAANIAAGQRYLEKAHVQHHD